MDTLKGYYATIIDTGCQSLDWIKDGGLMDACKQLNDTAYNLAESSLSNSSVTLQAVIEKMQNIWIALAPFVQIGQSIVVSNLGVASISLLTGLIALGIVQNIESKAVAAAVTVVAVSLAVFAGILLTGTPIVPMPITISLV